MGPVARQGDEARRDEVDGDVASSLPGVDDVHVAIDSSVRAAMAADDGTRGE